MDVSVDRDRAAAIEEVELAAVRSIVDAAAPDLAGRLGLRYVPVGRAGAVVAAGSDVPLLNRAIGLGLLAPADDATIDRVAGLWAGSGLTCLVQVTPHAETPALRAALEARGLRPLDAWAKVWRDDAPAPAAATDLRVEAVGRERAEDVARILCAGFGLPEAVGGLFASVLERDGWRAYLAFDGDEPVATGSLFVHGRVGALQAAATLPSHRRRGAQGALVARRISDGLALGCRLFAAEATEDRPEDPNPSYHNLLRAGFRLAYLRRNYVPVWGA
jgi:hypothetical protein